jgi:hypothetical protein
VRLSPGGVLLAPVAVLGRARERSGSGGWTDGAETEHGTVRGAITLARARSGGQLERVRGEQPSAATLYELTAVDAAALLRTDRLVRQAGRTYHIIAVERQDAVVTAVLREDAP